MTIRLKVLLSLLIIFATGCNQPILLGKPTAIPTFSVEQGARGKILFTAGWAESMDVYAINPDGSGLIRLTYSKYGDSNPVWSPCGYTFAYISGIAFEGDIFILNENGGNPRQLTKMANAYEDLSWSPDCTRLAYISSEKNGDVDHAIYIMKSDGTNITKIEDYQVYSLSWSPDGRKIAFTSSVTLFQNDIIVYDIQQDSYTQITDAVGNSVSYSSPIWSPDGSQLVFVESPPIGDTGTLDLRIFIRDLTSGELTLLAGDNEDVAYSIAWSPDGTKIAYCSNSNIFIMNPDGTEKKQITYGINECNPVWSPDGTKIAFISYKYTPYQVANVFVIDSDGSNLVQLTKDGTDNFVSWYP